MCFIIPLIVITVTYMRVCYHLYTSPLPGYSESVHRTRVTGQIENNHPEYCGCSGENSMHQGAIKLILDRRKKVIKLLITIVVVFAVLNTPFHVRELVENYYPGYPVHTNKATMVTIFTTLLLYSNSGINPLIYFIFSKKLRHLMIEAVVRFFIKMRLLRVHQSRSENIIMPDSFDIINMEMASNNQIDIPLEENNILTDSSETRQTNV